jgi:hypothetical protein
MTTPARTGPALAAFLLALALTAGACSSPEDDSETPAPAASGSSSPTQDPAPPPLATRVTFGELTGTLTKGQRPQFRKAVTGVVDGWLDAAYVSGDYPRHDFHDAFPRFTTGARADAHRDRALMSNQDIGKRIEGVRATRRRLWIDALVAGHQPAGVTARFVLGFRTTGKVERRIEVRGRLFLTRNHGWRVFGYDVTKGTVR